MKKYFFDAQKKQLEKPTEPLYVSCGMAKVTVIADNEADAYVLAADKFEEKFYGTGIAIGKPILTKTVELPVDWNYGYGDARGTGTDADKAKLVNENVIR